MEFLSSYNSRVPGIFYPNRSIYRDVIYAVSLLLMTFCQQVSADWSIAGAQYSCSTESEAFTLIPYEGSSEGTPLVKNDFTVLPKGVSNLACRIGERKLKVEVDVIPPQGRGMCMGSGVVKVASLFVSEVELLKNHIMFNWICYGTDSPIVKITVKNKGKLIEFEKSVSDPNTGEVTITSELFDVDAIAASNAKLDHKLDDIRSQEKNSATKLSAENDLAKVFPSTFPVKSSIPLCAHWTTTFLNSRISPELQRHARIAGKENDRVYIHKVNPQLCQSNDIDCTKLGYLIPGDRVDVGIICGSWVNIQYGSRALNKRPITGWVETNKLYDVDPLRSATSNPPTLFNLDSIVDPLLKAVYLKDTAKIKNLIASGSHPDGLNKLGRPLITAVSQKNLDVVKLLLKLGASINLEAVDTKCEILNLSLNDLEIFNFLLKSGMDINCQKKNDNSTVLMELASYNRVWAWERIYERDTSNNENFKTLIFLLKKLMSAGANPNIQDVFGRTALFYAMQANNVDVVDWLLENGASPNVLADESIDQSSMAEQNGSTPLMAALNWYSLTFDPTMFEVLLTHGADPNYRNKSTYNKEWDETTSGAVTFAGQTVLTRSAQDGHYRLVKVLLEHGADPRASREDGLSALLIADRSKQKNIAQLIKSYLKKSEN